MQEVALFSSLRSLEVEAALVKKEPSPWDATRPDLSTRPPATPRIQLPKDPGVPRVDNEEGNGGEGVYPQLYMKMKCVAKKCGVRFQPPAIILIYDNETQGKSRQRIMPVRNFSKFSDCTRAAEQLKNNPWHKSYLEEVSLKQLEKLFVFLRGYLQGQSLAETMEQIQRETTIDPEEDLNN
ncbi:hypothetical protein A6R68_06519 [Neotoma lepida]|uniref:Centrosomal protein of 19 kDa n=1 Tax=Neotoma lepida TaxID=56216 RepID=A0A1A6GGF8_NEOLE|nr:hypothetical protein A6R68_06519 [Neotoma lepida]